MATKRPNIKSRHHYENNKKKICEDVFTILTGLKSGTLSKRAAKNAINWAIVDWTTFDGQFSQLLKWSENACKAEAGDALIHEHSVPKKYIANMLLDRVTGRKSKKMRSLKEICAVFKKYANGAVVTKREDKELNKYRSSMPLGWRPETDCVWARYTDINIDIKLCTCGDCGTKWLA